MSTAENEVSEKQLEEVEADTFKFVSVTIPEGLKEGDTFTFKINNDEDEMEMVVPEGAKPGETIEVLLADEEDDEILDDISVSVALHPSVDAMITVSPFILDMVDEEKKADNDNDDDEEDGTNMMAWPAGVYLSQFLSTPNAKPIIDGKTSFLEIGSGLGVAGLGLISALNRDADAGNKKEVVLTDLPCAQTLLQANYEVNKLRVLKQDNVDVNITSLNWSDDESKKAFGESTQDKKFDVIIGSDLLYEASAESAKNLSSVMTSLLNPDSGIIIFSTRWRKADDERVFFENMESSGFEFVLASEYLTKLGHIPTISEDAEEEAVIEIFENNLSWKEFGSEDSEKSKKYFSETKVKVGENMVPIGEIEENNIDDMEEEDFDEYEMRYVQIYVGSKSG